jgi:GH24 family phage-related lysozyme (muramidase)
MGNAFDLQFRKGAEKVRCQDAELETLRKKIFMERLGGKMEWREINVLSLEPATFSNGDKGATSWIHVDVRQYAPVYLASRFYAMSQASADGIPLARIALQENRLSLLACGGINPATLARNAENDKRIPINLLSISEKGIDFIKGWEKCNLNPYNDKRNFCTIGWGHFIAPEKCESLGQDPVFKPFSNGILQDKADRLLMEDIQFHEKIIKKLAQVPMLQQEYDALVSLIFNAGSFQKCPKLLSKLNTKDYNGCCDEFEDITNNGDKGLIKRRNAEIRIFRHNIYDHSH